MTAPHQSGDLDLVLRRVRVGVTGHRTLVNPGAVRRGLEHVFQNMERLLPGEKHEYVIVSPLAEGADRLVAQWVLDNRPGSQLEAVLPMARKEYYETFSETERADSIREFDLLWSRAATRRELAKTGSHGDAYKTVGEEVVKICDVLIAIWDGQPARGEGGTAGVVDFARQNKFALFWLSPDAGKIRESSNLDRMAPDVIFLHEYNKEHIGDAEITRQADDRLWEMQDSAVKNGLDPKILEPLRLTVLPHFAKASALSASYQTRYFNSTYAAYIFSAAAVTTAAAGFLFFPGRHVIYALEFVEIAAVVVLTLTPRYRRLQRNWINYRFLAERLRASCFLFVVDQHGLTSETPADLRVSWLPEDRVLIAQNAILASLPKAGHTGRSVQHYQPGHDHAAKKFLLKSWIDDQRDYYRRKSVENQTKHDTLERSLLALLIISLTAALVHFFEGIWVSHVVDNVLDLIAVAFPAVASALGGISVFRHFNRTAERYESMADHLSKISREMTTPEAHSAPIQETALSPLQRLMREADAAMIHEHQGWRAVIGVHLPGPG